MRAVTGNIMVTLHTSCSPARCVQPLRNLSRIATLAWSKHQPKQIVRTISRIVERIKGQVNHCRTGKKTSMFEVKSPMPCQIIAFPLTNRVAKVRDVAAKIMEKATDRQAEAYRNQVADTLFRHLAKFGVPEDDQDEEVGAFFTAVELELSRLFDLHDAKGETTA
jgi:hypothetical protein